MLSQRAWELETNQVSTPENPRKLLPELYFRKVEKIALYITKHLVHWIVLFLVKYWYIFSAKAKKWLNKNSPKIINLLKIKKEKNLNQKPSFVRKALRELSIKIKRTKEKIKIEHEI